MEQEWWYADSNSKTGPLPLSDLLQHLGDDRINLNTLVWQPGWNEWMKLADVAEIRTQVLEILREQRRRVPPPLPTSSASSAAKSSSDYASSATAPRPTERPTSQIRLEARNDKQQLPLDWNKALAVWWSLSWRALIYGVLSGAVFGAIAGAYASLSGAPEKGAVYGAVAGWIATIPASMLALKQAISKHLASLAKLVHEAP